MSLAFNRTFAHQHYAALLLLVAFLLLSSCSVAFAQGGVGSTRGLPSSNGGIHLIQGRIQFPPGKTVMQVRVRLESNVAGSNSVLSNTDGAFSFQSLVAGTYTIIVDAGPEYEPVRETVTIYGSGGFGSQITPQTAFVPITLRLKGSSAADPLAKVPKEARDLYSKGMEEASKGDNKKAVEQLDKAVTLYPQFPQALSALGVQYLKLGKADKAVESLGAALKITPDDTNTRLSYGIALMNVKKFGEAETQFRQVLQKNSAVPTAHMYLGITLLSSSRDEKTKQYDMAKYTEAQKELEVATSTGKDEVAMAHRYLGGIYMGNKDYKRAADELEIYLKLSPKAADADKLREVVKDLRSKG